MLKNDAPGHPLIETVRIFNLYTSEFQMKKLPDGHPASSLQQRDHHAINVFRLDDRFNVCRCSDNSRINQRLANVFAALIQKADNFQLQFGPSDYVAREVNTR